MKRNYSLFQIDAFTSFPFQGNPAAVTFGPGLSDGEMQKIANEMNLSETAFITSSEKADYRLRWFTPKMEVDLCGHATIASLHFLNELGKINDRPKITFETRSGILSCTVENGLYYMQVPVMTMDEFEATREELVETLGIDPAAIPDKTPFILLENGYLYIYCQSLKAMQEMNPDFMQLNLLSLKFGFTAVIVFSLETYEPDSFAHSRFFGPYYGINEDPVTGSANGPLMLVLKKLGFLNDDENDVTKTFEQGDIMGRPGRIVVSHSPQLNELYIGGNAVTISRGELFL